MQTSEFGKSKGLWKSLSESTWSESFDALGISLLLTSNPSIQYTAFDQLKHRLLKRQPQEKNGTMSSPETLSAFSAFVLGAVSKCIMTFVIMQASFSRDFTDLLKSFHRCKITIQAADLDDEDETKEAESEKQKTISGALYSIWKREGLLGYNILVTAMIEMEKGKIILKLIISTIQQKKEWYMKNMIFV